MSLRCDHCRRTLNRSVHRYWRMQFCCTACGEGYRQRLQTETRTKISLLDIARPFERLKIGNRPRV